MAALAGIDLQCRRTCRADTFSVTTGLLIALNHRQRHLAGQTRDRGCQQAGLAGTGTGDQIQRQQRLLFKQLTIGDGITRVFTQDILFNLH